MRSEFKSYNPNLCKSHIFWSTANIQKWPKLVKSEKWPKFFHRVFFAFWIQICNQNLWKYHTFWNTANIDKWSFFAFLDLMTKIDEIKKNCPKLFHRAIFAFWIKICNPNLCKSHMFWITANIEKWFFFLHENRWNWKNCPKFFHRVIFAFWIQNLQHKFM